MHGAVLSTLLQVREEIGRLPQSQLWHDLSPPSTFYPTHREKGSRSKDLAAPGSPLTPREGTEQSRGVGARRLLALCTAPRGPWHG